MMASVMIMGETNALTQNAKRSWFSACWCDKKWPIWEKMIEALTIKPKNTGGMATVKSINEILKVLFKFGFQRRNYFIQNIHSSGSLEIS